jgi:hypothetical protein
MFEGEVKQSGPVVRVEGAVVDRWSQTAECEGVDYGPIKVMPLKPKPVPSILPPVKPTPGPTRVPLE